MEKYATFRFYQNRMNLKSINIFECAIINLGKVIRSRRLPWLIARESETDLDSYGNISLFRL